MNKEKAILTQKQYDAIDTLLNDYYEYEIINMIVKKEIKSRKNLFCLYELSLDELCRALYVGYKVEKTPEEHLEHFYHLTTQSDKDCIKEVLRILNIKIKGIND